MIRITETDLDQAGFYMMFKSTKLEIVGWAHLSNRNSPLGKFKIWVSPFVYYLDKLIGKSTYRRYMKARVRIKRKLKFKVKGKK